MSYTFSDCTSLVNAPVVPNGVTDMRDTFEGCTSLSTAPIIPSSVRDITRIFNLCTSLTGNVIIESEYIGTRYANNAFINTVLPITVKAKQGTTTWTTLSGITFPSNVTLQPYQ